jgi:hypothetical protein
MITSQQWLEQVRADSRASGDICKVAAAIVECARENIDTQFGIGNGYDGVYADEVFVSTC